MPSQATQYHGVSRAMQQAHGVIRDGCVELRNRRRSLLREEGFIVAEGTNPRSRGPGVRGLPKDLLDVDDRPRPILLAVDLAGAPGERY